MGSILVGLTSSSLGLAGALVGEAFVLVGMTIGAVLGLLWVLRRSHLFGEHPSIESSESDEGMGVAIAEILPDLDLDVRIEEARNGWKQVKASFD